jgi:hypothetical protein
MPDDVLHWSFVGLGVVIFLLCIFGAVYSTRQARKQEREVDEYTPIRHFWIVHPENEPYDWEEEEKVQKTRIHKHFFK